MPTGLALEAKHGEAGDQAEEHQRSKEGRVGPELKWPRRRAMRKDCLMHGRRRVDQKEGEEREGAPGAVSEVKART